MPTDTSESAPAAVFPPGAQVTVLLPLPVDTYDYRVPEDVAVVGGLALGLGAVLVVVTRRRLFDNELN